MFGSDTQIRNTKITSRYILYLIYNKMITMIIDVKYMCKKKYLCIIGNCLFCVHMIQNTLQILHHIMFSKIHKTFKLYLCYTFKVLVKKYTKA